MARKKEVRGTLVYPSHAVQPEDLLHFVEMEFFTSDWDAFGFPEEELGNLQVSIMISPKRAPVIKGTHGLRKMRYSPSTWNQGKRGALRVCYVYFEAFHIILLVVVYTKSECDTLSKKELAGINDEIDRIEDYLKERLF